MSEDHFAAEFHAVHKAADNLLLVVGIPIKAGLAADLKIRTNTRRFVLDLLNLNFPSTIVTESRSVCFHFGPLLKAASPATYWAYAGSLTTPPCTEGLQWIVLGTPLNFDRAVLAQLEDLMPFNSRFTQDANGRSAAQVV